MPNGSFGWEVGDAPTRRGRSYPLELKLRVVREIVERGQTVYSTAKAFGLGPSTVKDWLLRYEARPLKHGPTALAMRRGVRLERIRASGFQLRVSTVAILSRGVLPASLEAA